MTDKQIIIDGVDISGCEFYWREKELCNNGNLTSDCQENKDCLYKKYKRKEQEYFELANVYNSLVRIANNRLDKITDLQQQLDQLKAQLLDQEAETLKAGGIIHILGQALTEIKEIAEKSYRTPLAEKDCIKCNEFLEQILQKISEVEND